MFKKQRLQLHNSKIVLKWLIIATIETSSLSTYLSTRNGACCFINMLLISFNPHTSLRSIYSWVNVRCCYFSRTKSSSWRLPNLYMLICSQNSLLCSVGFVVISPFSFLKLVTCVFLPYFFVSLAREYSYFTFLQVIRWFGFPPACCGLWFQSQLSF